MNLLTTFLMTPLLAMAQQGEGGDLSTAQDDNETEPAETEEVVGKPSANDPVSRAEFEALRAELEETKARLDESELAELEEMSVAESGQGVDIFGFFDLNFSRFFMDEDSFFHGLVPEHASFYVQNLNLYVSHRMTETLSFLSELRFTFRPLGEELSYEMAGISEYDRVDTLTSESHINSNFRLGGVAIERVHLTWQPKDWLGVLAGRYLTPFGIWNVEHGSPVLIGAHPPFIQTHKLVPLAQTGLQVFGRFYPGTNHYIDYAFTVSNGRGPVDALIDLDANKGTGLRLRYLYKGKNFSAAFGGYGYYGTYGDTKRVLELAPQFDVYEEITESYAEYVVTGDILLEFYGVRLQGEYGRGYNEYSERPRRDASLGYVGYQPDYVAQIAYGMLAYTLPLDRWLGTMSLTPYFLFEHTETDDSVPDIEVRVINGGINFKPSPFVVLKADYANMSSYNRNNRGFSKATIQLAVSF